MKKLLGMLLWTLNLVGWFVRYTVLIVFSLMVFAMFVGIIFYFGYEFGYLMGVGDTLELISSQTPPDLEA